MSDTARRDALIAQGIQFNVLARALAQRGHVGHQNNSHFSLSIS